jgi:hypothetical protein
MFMSVFILLALAWFMINVFRTYFHMNKLIDEWFSTKNPFYKPNHSISDQFNKHLFALFFFRNWRDVYPEPIQNMIKAKGL